MYIVAYDVTDDKERRKVSRVLDGYGHSVQKSVYICHIGETLHRKMLKSLNELDVKTGVLLCWKMPDTAEPEKIGAYPEGLPLRREKAFVL